MVERWQWGVWIAVVLGHVAVLLWLIQTMVPRIDTAPEESVLIIEFLPSPPPPPTTAASVEPETPPPVRRLPTRRVSAAVMEAVIEPAPARAPAIATPNEHVAPERDPFALPSAPARGFGRRDVPTLPDSQRPHIAGEAPPNPVIPQLRRRGVSPKQVIEGIAAFLGGGPNAPVEVPCGGRLNGGSGTAESFSPAWQQHYGCDRSADNPYDGTVELPPGVAR